MLTEIYVIKSLIFNSFQKFEMLENLPLITAYVCLIIPLFQFPAFTGNTLFTLRIKLAQKCTDFFEEIITENKYLFI